METFTRSLSLTSHRRIIAEEGIGSLWRGALPNVIQYVPRQAITFGFHESFRNFFDMDKKVSEGIGLFLNECFVENRALIYTRKATRKE